MQFTTLLIVLLLVATPLMVSCRPQGELERDAKQHTLLGMSRFIKFKTDGQGDKLKVELAFGVPFLSLPLRRKSTDGASVDVNLRGMALAAGLGAVASVFNLLPSPLETESGLSIG